MALALTNSFKAGDQVVLSKWDTNFTEIATELSAFPTKGAFGTEVVTEIEIAAGAVTSAKVVDNIQFETLPKCLSGSETADFTHDDHLVNLFYLLAQKTAVFSDGDFVNGEVLFDQDTSNVNEKITLPNSRIYVVGYQTCPNSTQTGSGVTLSSTLDLTDHGFTDVFALFPFPCCEATSYGRISEVDAKITALTPTSATVKLYARSVAAINTIYGYFYFAIGK